jgi:hypothetical protein
MNGPLKDGHMEAAREEIKTLEEMSCWVEVNCKLWMNVLPDTWAFQAFPSGLVRKLKRTLLCTQRQTNYQC